MDFHLKQWRNQHDDESDQQQQQPSAPKMPKHLLDQHHHQQHSFASSTALPLFAPEPNSTNKVSNLSALPDHSSPSATTTTITTSPKFTRMGSYFSLAQIEELQLQALIYRYMLAGAAVPPELLQPIKKSLLHSTSYFLHHPLSHYSYCQPTMFQTGYWGRGAMDPEPGRCRRTDGKKWRCSRDVVAGQKYCERHVHRGRSRSRKPVEIPTPSSTTTTTATGSGGGVAAAGSLFNSSSSTTPTACSSLSTVASGTNISLSRQSHNSVDLLHLNHSCSDSKTESKGLLGATQNDQVGHKPDGHVLRHFFDDWPRSLQEPDCNAGSNASPLSSATCLSISMPGNSSSDVSLKLSTGNGEEPAGGHGGNEREQPLLNWGGSGWGTNQVSSMGGPLAEALRSSVSNSSPTSVLHQLPRGSASEASYVST